LKGPIVNNWPFFNIKTKYIINVAKNYLNNKDLYDQIVISKEQDKLTPEAEKMLILLAERAIRKLSYVSDEDRQDCLQFAILNLLRYWRGFNPKYKNAFAYFTEIAKKGYAKGWNKIHPKKYKSTLSLDSTGFNQDSDGGMFNI
jgi:hypothetical protein